MTSPSPLLYDTYYHIYHRGVNGEDVFIEERNYDLFLRLFEKYLNPAVDLFSYCLLKNHFPVSVRMKLEDEIKKTLRVSTASGPLRTKVNLAKFQPNQYQLQKP